LSEWVPNTMVNKSKWWWNVKTSHEHFFEKNMGYTPPQFATWKSMEELLRHHRIVWSISLYYLCIVFKSTNVQEPSEGIFNACFSEWLDNHQKGNPDGSRQSRIFKKREAMLSYVHGVWSFFFHMFSQSLDDHVLFFIRWNKIKRSGNSIRSSPMLPI
jgi:hypothetical protein